MISQFKLWMVPSLIFFLSQPTIVGQTPETSRIRGREQVSLESKARAKKLLELIKKAREENPTGPILSTRDIHQMYRPIHLRQDPLTGAIRRQYLQKNAEVRRKLQVPKHRASILAAPASLLGPISLGPAYGILMFQNSLNYWPEWQGPALPWNGSIGARYLLSSGPLTIPYEMALQNRLVMTTVTDTYGNQMVTLSDTATGYSTQYQIVGRLDGNPPPGTASSIYGGGYYVSTYNGQILGTNTSSFPGVYIPGAPFQTTFGYQGDLDTLGPFGRGHTPLNPPGPSATFMPGISAPLNGGSILP